MDANTYYLNQYLREQERAELGQEFVDDMIQDMVQDAMSDQELFHELDLAYELTETGEERIIDILTTSGEYAVTVMDKLHAACEHKITKGLK